MLFGAVAFGTFHLSKSLSAAYERLAIIASRTSVFLVNFGFWVGSLWGDNIAKSGQRIDDSVFAVGWALGLIVLAVWATHRNRRWVVNVAAVFGAIHFYTQWFEYLGPRPASVLIGGLVALAFALGLRHFNQKLKDRQVAASDQQAPRQ